MKKVREGKRSAKGAKNAKGKKAKGRRRKVVTKKKKQAMLEVAADPVMGRNKDIAKAAGLSGATFYRLMKFDPALKKLIEEAKDQAVDKVEMSMFASAVGFEVKEVTMEPMLVVNRVRKGEKEKVVMREKLVVTKIVTKIEPPNVKAGEFLLLNRRRKEYKNRSLVGSDPENPLSPPVIVLPGFKGGLINGIAAVSVDAGKK